jgi:17beta-estradiol 17-dehydrogenase / very-long-chain 3-oxoacyl-CoA reductase
MCVYCQPGGINGWWPAEPLKEQPKAFRSVIVLDILESNWIPQRQAGKNTMGFHKLLSAVGALTIFYFLADILNGFYARFIRGGKNLKKCYGQWAIVTGGTDGIGLAMADELAKKGLNILLISRSEGKLADSKGELSKKYSGIEVRTLAIDYSAFDEKARNVVAAAVKDIEVGVLVNNVGMSYPFTKYFDELTDSEVTNLIALNVESTTWMTRICLPAMTNRKKGAIVNISSSKSDSAS